EVIVIAHKCETNHWSVAFRSINQDDALSSAILLSELAQIRSLAVAALTNGQYLLTIRIADRQTDNSVIVCKVDTLHACSVAAHGSHLLFRETNALALACANQQIFGTVRNCSCQQLVAFFDAYADNTLFSEVLVVEKRGF